MANRQRLPNRRKGFTQKVRIGNTKVYLRTGEYDDGKIGEIFIDVHKEGTFARGMCNGLGMMTSLALQHGVPLEEVCNLLRHINFPPNGEVEGSPYVRVCSSLPDYIAQELLASYDPGTGKRRFVVVNETVETIEMGLVVDGKGNVQGAAFSPSTAKPFDGTYPMPEDRGTLNLTDHAVEKEEHNHSE